MRKKALLAEASSLFEGPEVKLEDGIWEIRGVEGCLIEIKISGQPIEVLNGRPLVLKGPIVVSCKIISENINGVHLDARQIGH